MMSNFVSQSVAVELQDAEMKVWTMVEVELQAYKE